MTTLRTHLTIKRSVDDVWSVVSDAAAIATGFPMVQTSTCGGAQRYCQLTGGIPIFEQIVTNDPERDGSSTASTAVGCRTAPTWAPPTCSTSTGPPWSSPARK